MKIMLHGGNCCGVKHITNLGAYPEVKLGARKAVKEGTSGTSFGQGFYGATNDMRSHSPASQNDDFFNSKAPSEEHHKRLKRFINFLKKHRTHHCIEIILNSGQMKWYPYLEEFKFRKVSEFKNSNTGSVLTVWHLTY